MRRFYAPDIDPSSAAVELDPEQSAHVRTVLRLKAGDEVSVFDGKGGEFACRVATVTRSAATLEIIGPTAPACPESHLTLTLGVSLLKNDKFDLVVQKAVELGVSNLVPVASARCDVRADAAAKRLDRLRRIAIESSKQCGRATLMEITDPVDFESFLAGAYGYKVMFSERSGDRLAEATEVSEMTVLTGPEGGWEDKEIRLADEAGFSIVTLGGRVLRAETAAITAAVLIQNRFGDLDR